MPTFKEKLAQFKHGQASLALFSYPVLQAADILLYKASHVPVGDDQQVHLLFARDMACSFNNKYAVRFFPVPDTIKSQLTKVKNLREPTSKMSKSDEKAKGRIG